MKKKPLIGVPHRGTPIFLSRHRGHFAAGNVLWFLLLLLGLASGSIVHAATSAMPVLPKFGGNSTTAAADKAVLFADEFQYAEITGNLIATGNVRVWYGAITLTAQEAEADLEKNHIHAKGEVVLAEAGSKLKCSELDYDLTTRSARLHGIQLAAYPWYYQGESIDKEGDSKVAIAQASFTTCNARHPHYHITARKMEIVLGESLTAYEAVLYVGTTPLFYFPWFTRSLKDKRPPFSIRMGYNDFEGVYAKLGYNYYLQDGIYGSLLLDLMEKKGVGFGLDQKVQYSVLGKGECDLSGLYIKDTQLQQVRWTSNVNERHEFSSQDLLQLNFDYLSDQNMNRDFSLNQVDTFQQKSYVSYSHHNNDYYFNVGAQDTENLDPVSNQYYPVLRQLPSATFSLSSLKATDWRFPLYFNLNSSFIRSDEALNFDHRYRYRDDLTLAPGFTETWALPVYVPTQPALSGSLTFPLDGNYKEEFFPELVQADASGRRQEANAAYNGTLTLTNKWVNYRRTKPTYLFQSRLSYNYSQKYPLLPTMPALPHTGITSNRVGLATDYYMGDFFTAQAETGYQLNLLQEKERWQERMDPLLVSGRAQFSPAASLSWQGQHAWDQDRITSAFVSGNLAQRAWNVSCGSSYSYTGLPAQPYSLFGTLSAGLRPDIGVSVSSMLQYDFMTKQFTNLSLTLSHDLHCWDMQAGFKIYADGKMELGLGLSLKAFPEVKVGMGGPSGVSVGQ